jgi:hypothetical protein
MSDRPSLFTRQPKSHQRHTSAQVHASGTRCRCENTHISVRHVILEKGCILMPNTASVVEAHRT